MKKEKICVITGELSPWGRFTWRARGVEEEIHSRLDYATREEAQKAWEKYAQKHNYKCDEKWGVIK
ncbi:MAG: hypothetical protein GY853_13535 [PVC group bacterium]|nr:hypothetical protein [PVC group bacterium]